MDKVVAVGKLVATFAVGKIFPAGFAINIPLPVNDVVIFIVDEVFPAVGTLLQVFIPAIRAKVKLPVDFEFFHRSADVTFHDSLHWLVVTTTRRRFAGNRVRLLIFRLLNSLHKHVRVPYSYASREKVNGIKA